MSAASVRSVSSCSSYACSDPSSSTSYLFASTSSPLGSLHHASPEATSSIISRLVPKSALAKKIQKARQAAEKDVEQEQRRSEKVEAAPLSKRERIQAKFLKEEKQWKKDALLDSDARIVEGMKALGM